MEKKEIIKKYKDKTLGRANGEDSLYFYVEDFTDPEEAYLIFWQIWGHESDLTKEGFDFLKEYYGLEELAEFFSKKGGFDETKDKVSILNWLLLQGR